MERKGVLSEKCTWVEVHFSIHCEEKVNRKAYNTAGPQTTQSNNFFC